MSRFQIDRGKVAAFAVGAVMVGLVLGGGVAFANDGGTIHACVSPAGLPRLVVAPGDCKSFETLLNWSITGPQGPAGPQGDDGSVT